MSQSPADRDAGKAPTTASEVFLALERAYDQALQASMSGDLETCADLLTACDVLLERAQDTLRDESTEDARQSALSAHARLTSILTSQRNECAGDMARVQLGKKALQGYAGERTLGSRVESRA